MFLSLRKRYWTDENRDLPSLDRVLVGFVDMKEFDGRHIYDHRPYLNPDKLHFIPIGSELIGNEEECEQTLLHEMAHLAASRSLKDGDDSHGPAWRAEMARLVRLGAVKLD
jgi:predicted SprT family Zn-dependent metalloprotease